MKIISIAGATSKAGKTLVAEQVIRYCAAHHSNVYAVKFTTTSDLPSPCPRGAPCTVCDLSGQFRIVRDPETILQPGKNTQRFAAANAAEVIWVIAKKSYMPVAYSHLLTHIPNEAIAVMEGSTITSICKPDLLIYVLANHISPSRWKDSAPAIMERSDFVIVNRKRRMQDHPELQVPHDAMRLDVFETPVTAVGEIRARMDSLLGIESAIPG